jgi:hypothetical protein
MVAAWKAAAALGFQAPLRHRAGDRLHEGGRTAWPQLPQQPARRSSQHHPLRRWPERPPTVQVVHVSFVLLRGLALRRRLTPTGLPGLSRSRRQKPFLTGDYADQQLLDYVFGGGR